MKTVKDLRKLFTPSSVAVVGASRDVGKLGGKVFAALLEGNFHGRLYPINRDSPTVQGVPAFSELKAVGGAIDLVLILLPRERVAASVEECVNLEVPFAFIYTSGFGEVGERGRVFDRQLLAASKQGYTRLVGPNAYGLISTSCGLNCVPRARVKDGPVGVITQSGNICNTLAESLTERGIGVNKLVTIGNQLDLTVADFIDDFAADPRIRTIGVYLEGVPEEARLFDSIENVGRKSKAVVVLKAGTTNLGARSAKAHVAAPDLDDALLDKGMSESGGIRVYSLSEMVDSISSSLMPLPLGNRVGAVTVGGGPGTIFSDACEWDGLDLPELSDKLRYKLLSIHNETVDPACLESVNNPIDIGNRELSVPYQEVLQYTVKGTEVLLGKNEVDIIVVIGLGFSRDASEVKIAEDVVALRSRTEKPIYLVTSSSPSPAAEYLRGIPGVFFSERSASLAISRSLRFGRHVRRSSKSRSRRSGRPAPGAS